MITIKYVQISLRQFHLFALPIHAKFVTESNNLANTARLSTRIFHRGAGEVHTFALEVSHGERLAKTGDLRPHVGANQGPVLSPNLGCMKTCCGMRVFNPDLEMRLRLLGGGGLGAGPCCQSDGRLP